MIVSTQRQKKTENYQDGSFIELWSDCEHFDIISSWEYTSNLGIFFHICENRVSFILFSPTISLFMIFIVLLYSEITFLFLSLTHLNKPGF